MVLAFLSHHPNELLHKLLEFHAVQQLLGSISSARIVPRSCVYIYLIHLTSFQLFDMQAVPNYVFTIAHFITR